MNAGRRRTNRIDAVTAEMRAVVEELKQDVLFHEERARKLRAAADVLDAQNAVLRGRIADAVAQIDASADGFGMVPGRLIKQRLGVL